MYCCLLIRGTLTNRSAMLDWCLSLSFMFQTCPIFIWSSLCLYVSQICMCITELLLIKPFLSCLIWFTSFKTALQTSMHCKLHSRRFSLRTTASVSSSMMQRARPLPSLNWGSSLKLNLRTLAKTCRQRPTWVTEKSKQEEREGGGGRKQERCREFDPSVFTVVWSIFNDGSLSKWRMLLHASWNKMFD